MEVVANTKKLLNILEISKMPKNEAEIILLYEECCNHYHHLIRNASTKENELLLKTKLQEKEDAFIALSEVITYTAENIRIEYDGSSSSDIFSYLKVVFVSIILLGLIWEVCVYSPTKTDAIQKIETGSISLPIKPKTKSIRRLHKKKAKNKPKTAVPLTSHK